MTLNNQKQNTRRQESVQGEKRRENAGAETARGRRGGRKSEKGFRHTESDESDHHYTSRA